MGSMTEYLIKLMEWMPHELSSVLLASLPVTELRAALPIARFVFGLSAFESFAFTFIGNLIPIVLVYAFLPSLVSLAKHQFPVLDRKLFAWFDSLKRKYGDSYSKWGAFFLCIFVAIPLPGTGVWTGCVLAILFGIRRTLAISYIIAGLFIAGMIVLALTEGVFQGVNFL